MNHAVICELNPLHSGHIHLFSEIRRFDPDAAIVCIMSGFFVQRGEAAIYDKFTRARSAVENGADLVLELPLPFCMRSAQGFAEAGVNVAERLSCIDFLWFGSECGDVGELTKAAENLLSDSFKAALKKELVNARKNNYATAVSGVYSDLFAGGAILKEPNNLLAVEYIRALKESSSKTRPMTIKRIGSAHNITPDRDNNYCSTAIRNRILTEIKTAGWDDPANPASLAFNDRWIVSKLREAADNHEISKYQYCKGIEDRILKAVLTARELNELFELIKTKSLTMSRVRRAVLSIALGIENTTHYDAPEYTCLLAANRKGTDLLSETRRSRGIKVVTKPAKLSELAKTSPQAKLNLNAQSIYTLFMHKPQTPGFFLKKSPYIEKNSINDP